MLTEPAVKWLNEPRFKWLLIKSNIDTDNDNGMTFNIMSNNNNDRTNHEN